jgi:hypothetical protein
MHFIVLPGGLSPVKSAQQHYWAVIARLAVAVEMTGQRAERLK